jgi:hypothetical protein
MSTPASKVEPARPGRRRAQAETDRYDAFVSYAREEFDFVAGVLLPELRQRGKQIWVDLEAIPPAAGWRARVMAGIESAWRG